jgi:hypothetical protein
MVPATEKHSPIDITKYRGEKPSVPESGQAEGNRCCQINKVGARGEKFASQLPLPPCLDLSASTTCRPTVPKSLSLKDLSAKSVF